VYDEDSGKIVILPDITVHIIEDESKKKESKPSQSQEKSQEEVREQEQKEREEQEKQREEEIRRQMQQQEENKKLQNRMQNNQLNQNTQTLKKEMKEQQQNQQQLKETIEKDQEFQEMAKEILDKGYNFTGAEIHPESNNSGDFQYSFEDENGNSASIEGDVEDSEITDIRKKEEVSLDNLMEKIQNDPVYQRYDQELMTEGFKQAEPQLNRIDDNNTRIELKYEDAANQTATILVDFERDEITDVELSRKRNIALWFLLPLFLVGLLFLYFRKKDVPVDEVPVLKKVDFRKESISMLDEAEKLYEKDMKKDAYGKVSEAVRFYYSYKVGDKKELTNNELITLLRSKKISPAKTTKCLKLCSLVEFAKYRPNRKDFDKIMGIARKIIA